MGLFNKLKRTKKATPNTTNLAGGQAYKQTPEMELLSILLTSFAQDRHYRSGNDTMKRMVQLLGKVDALFAAQAAIYARKAFGMRSISHVLAAELASYATGTAWAKYFYAAIVKRPDDMLEIAAYYKHNISKMLPNAMKKGFAMAFDQFDDYQIAKYRGASKTVKLIDIVNLVHPTPTQKNALGLQQLVDGTLKNEMTWEAQLSAAGQNAPNERAKARMKAKVWRTLLDQNRLGYFALLRNLRNIKEQAPNHLKVALRQLTDPKRIKKSLVLPFRLLTAYKQLQGNSTEDRLIRQALDRAIEIACDNIPVMENTLVVVDNSGSMNCAVANSQHLKCNEAGAVFAMALAKRCNADILEFGTTARYIPYNLKDSILDFSATFEAKNKVGHGTNFNAIFNTAKKAYKRIVIFSDMQGWIGYNCPKVAYQNYCARYKAQPFVYSIDLAGYGTMQFPEQKVCCLAGFSEKIFDLFKVVETDKRALIKKVKAIDF